MTLPPGDAPALRVPGVHRLSAAVRQGWERFVRRLRDLPRAAGRAGHRLLRVRERTRRTWRTSLRARVTVITVGAGALAVIVLGWYLTGEIRTGMFHERVEQMLGDAAERTATAQESIDYATATTGQEVQQLANDLVGSLQGSGSGLVGTLLLRSPSDLEHVLIIDPVTDPQLIGIISPELRAAVQRQGGQQWQSVAVPAGGSTVPGIAVGSPVTLKSAGPYELYFVYSLAPEDETLHFVQRTLALGGAALLALVAVMAWYLTRKVLLPVRQAAVTAERLSAGRLGERMHVRGHDELATLARSFNEMAENLQDQIRRMEELSTMQQRFVSDVSHELRTPLTTIRMAGDLIHGAREEFRPAVARSAELLAAQLDRFDALLADLLEISRFDAGAAVLDVEVWDVRSLVERVVEAAAPLAEGKGSELVVRAPPEPCTAELDRRRVERILRNLVVNAIEHGEGRPVEIEVSVDEDVVAVVVRDHGVGMTPHEAEHAFDRFWRADPARARTTGGTGLGLAISLEDARLHRGTLEASGRRGAGASFLLRLPRRAAVEAPPLELAARAPSGKNGFRARHRPGTRADLDRLGTR